MTKFTITMAATIVIVIIMKAIATIKAVMIIKLIVLRRHQPQKKLFSYLETAWSKIKRFFTNTKTEP